MKNDRRVLLKALTLGTGAVGAAKLPTQWTKPVVDAVTLPAHAQTTAAVLSGGGSVLLIAHSDQGSAPFRQFVRHEPGRDLLERFIPSAHAVPVPSYAIEKSNLRAYAEPRGAGEYRVEVLLELDASPDYSGTFNDTGGPDLLASMVTPAHANGLTNCYASILWAATVGVSGNPASGSKANVGIDDECGNRFFPDVRLDLELTVNATGSGQLKVKGGPIDTELSLSTGGSPLKADCRDMACPPIENTL